MKLEIEQDTPKFEPIKLAITIENEEELIDLYCFFRYAPIVDFLDRIPADDIRNLLANEYQDDLSEAATARFEAMVENTRNVNDHLNSGRVG